MAVNFVGKLNVRAAGESFDCCVTGIALVSPDEIVLADYYNNSVKVVNIGKDTITRTYKLSAAPWDVTAIDSITFATTLPEKGRILFVNTKKGPSERDSLQVKKGCWGIDHKNGVIAVSFSKPSAVQILDKTGNTLHEFSIQELFDCQSYICFSTGNNSIFLSDNQNHSVHQLSMDGQQMPEVKCGDLKNPAGLTVMKNDTVIICGVGNSDRVTMLQPGTRECVSVLVNDLHKPCCVTVCEGDRRLYIGSDAASVDRNCIKVYDLQ